ncbi:hexokinase-1 [Stagonosporopsis vannaccii]|nr:hexokinase-1 [Stagonosporopsis vannaccii]
MVAPKDALDDLTSCLQTGTLLDLARRFSEKYRSLAQTSTEHFLITPVTALPTGKEKGKFLAIDVGGSNLRVGFVELTGVSATADHGEHDVEDVASTRIKRSHDKSWPIGDHLKMDQPEDLFKWIGDCMAEVIREAIDNDSIPTRDDILLGVTFSFPMAQTSLSEATLLPMGKGFAITTNLNLGEMLLAGYSRHCSISFTESASKMSQESGGKLLPRIRVVAITNDTVATFVSLAYVVKTALNSRVAMGLIVGTGTNATIPMRPNSLHPEKQSQLPDLSATDTVVINTEWTICGTDEPLDALGIKTKWDRILDENSDAPGFQPFEYMTSGRYLGEIVRLAFVDTLSNETGTAGIPESLQHKNAIPTWFLSEVVARSDKASLPSRLEEHYPSSGSADGTFWTSARTLRLYDLARAVQQRSSALVGAASVGLLGCVGEIDLDEPGAAQPEVHSSLSNGAPEVDELVIAYTGGTISQYPRWLEDCQAWIDRLVAASATRSGKQVVLQEALDGGVIGAGVLAGMGSSIS